MNVKLIPVIEITYYNEHITSPINGPYWEYADEWDSYHRSCLIAAGFNAEIKAFSKGCSFYELSEITKENLTKLVLDETQDMRESDNDRDLCGSFSGGYILNIDGENVLYPQCCGSLSDINSWQELMNNGVSAFWIGHPSPGVTLKENAIVFDLEHSNVNEKYVPAHNKLKIEIDKNDLADAINNAKVQLDHFSEQLLSIGVEQELNIPDLDRLLIYGK